MDLTHRCEACGTAISGRADKLYCSKRCANDAFTRLDQEARQEALAGRVCAACGGPIRVTKRAHARFCSRRCLHGNGNPSRWPKETRTCLGCGATFQPYQRSQVYCSRACVPDHKRGPDGKFTSERKDT